MTKDKNFKKFTEFLKKYLYTDFGAALLITAIWKIIMLSVGFLVDSSINGAVGILSHTIRWDSGWYITVIKDNYVTSAASAVFYPLFPMAVSLVRFISFNTIDLTTAGQIVNTVSVWFVVAALIIIGRKFLGNKKRFWLVALVLSAPTAFFMHVFYSEALFMALGFWAYIYALRHKWLYMGIILAILTSARLPSLLIIGLCGLEFMRAYNWDFKKILNIKLLYFMLAPVGFIAYGLYLLKVQGDFFAMFHAYKTTTDWIYQVFDINFVKTILRASYETFRALIGQRAFNTDILINHAIPIISLGFLFISSVYLFVQKKNKYIPLGIFGIASIVMFTLNSNVVSVHRYVLPILTIYVALALAIKGKYQRTILIIICAAGLALQFLLFSLFIGNIFAG